MPFLTYDDAVRALTEGLTPVDVFENWRKRNPDAHPKDVEMSRLVLREAWAEARSKNIKLRRKTA